MTAIETTFGDRDLPTAAPLAVVPRLRSDLERLGTSPRSVAVGATVAVSAGALLPASTMAHRSEITFVAFALMLLAFAGCKAARKSSVAWRTELLLRAVAGGTAVAASAGMAAQGLEGRADPGSLALLAAGATAALMAACRGRDDSPDVPLDLRDRPAEAFPDRTAALPLLCRAVKRTIDLVVGVTAAVLVVPVVAVLAVVISLNSPGGWLFRQTRVGQDGRRFTLYKLRTMKAANDDSRHRAYVAALIVNNERAGGELYKIADDPRITSVGRWIRKLSLDELPQLLNVMKGDMSLVGPRPPLPSETELYDDVAKLRLRCKPGMTGLWQVSGRSRVGFDEMVAMDISYWRDWSLRTELGILARTARAVFAADTA